MKQNEIIMNDIEKEFVPYQQSLDMRDLGFDEPCIKYYWIDGMLVAGYENTFNYNKRDNVISAPLNSQVFRFFREKYPSLHFGCGKIYDGTNNYHFHINLIWEYFTGNYEQAELACLIKLIELAKNGSLKA